MSRVIKMSAPKSKHASLPKTEALTKAQAPHLMPDRRFTSSRRSILSALRPWAV